MSAPPTITPGELVERYDALLLDAYGVLVDAEGVHAEAVAFVAELNERSTPYLVVTNDASKLPETSSARLRSFGLPIGADRILTSGSLLAGYFCANELAGARCAVIGPEDSRAYVERAGGEVVELVRGEGFEVLALCDEEGVPLLEALDAALTGVVRRLDAGRDVRLVLPNPDLLYPKGNGRFGVAAGSLAALLESILAQRYPSRDDLRFERLGKPFAPLFEAAVERLGTRRLVMVGDQLATDILGATRFGIDSVLVGSGLTTLDGDWGDDGPRPTWVTRSLSGGAR